MGRENRRGERRPRGGLQNQRIPELGYYIIVTDAKETERTTSLAFETLSLLV